MYAAYIDMYKIMYLLHMTMFKYSRMHFMATVMSTLILIFLQQYQNVLHKLSDSFNKMSNCKSTQLMTSWSNWKQANACKDKISSAVNK